MKKIVFLFCLSLSFLNAADLIDILFKKSPKEAPKSSKKIIPEYDKIINEYSSLLELGKSAQAEGKNSEALIAYKTFLHNLNRKIRYLPWKIDNLVSLVGTQDILNYWEQGERIYSAVPKNNLSKSRRFRNWKMDGDQVFCIIKSNFKHKLACLKKDTGETSWVSDLSEEKRWRSLSVTPEKVYVCISDKAEIFNHNDGSLVKVLNFSTGGYKADKLCIPRLLIFEDLDVIVHVLYPEADIKFYTRHMAAYKISTGEQLWKKTLNNKAEFFNSSQAQPRMYDSTYTEQNFGIMGIGNTVFCYFEGKINKIDPVSGKQNILDHNKNPITEIWPHQGNILFNPSFGSVMLFDIASETFTDLPSRILDTYIVVGTGFSSRKIPVIDKQSRSSSLIKTDILLPLTVDSEKLYRNTIVQKGENFPWVCVEGNSLWVWNKDRMVYLLDKEKGEIEWELSVPGSYSGLDCSGDRITVRADKKCSSLVSYKVIPSNLLASIRTAYMGIASSYISLDDSANAVKYLKELITFDQTNSAAYQLLAEQSGKLGNTMDETLYQSKVVECFSKNDPAFLKSINVLKKRMGLIGILNKTAIERLPGAPQVELERIELCPEGLLFNDYVKIKNPESKYSFDSRHKAEDGYYPSLSLLKIPSGEIERGFMTDVDVDAWKVSGDLVFTWATHKGIKYRYCDQKEQSIIKDSKYSGWPASSIEEMRYAQVDDKMLYTRIQPEKDTEGNNIYTLVVYNLKKKTELWEKEIIRRNTRGNSKYNPSYNASSKSVVIIKRIAPRTSSFNTTNKIHKGHEIICYDIETGEEKWKTRINDTGVSWWPSVHLVITDTDLCVISNNSMRRGNKSYIHRLNPESGEQLGKITIPYFIEDVYRKHGNVFLAYKRGQNTIVFDDKFFSKKRYNNALSLYEGFFEQSTDHKQGGILIGRKYYAEGGLGIYNGDTGQLLGEKELLNIREIRHISQYGNYLAFKGDNSIYVFEWNKLKQYMLEPDLVYAVKTKNTPLVAELLKKGSNINVTDSDNGTPLFYAVSENSLDIVKMLFKAGAEVNLTTDYWDSTPILRASKKGYDDILKILIAYGGNVDVETDGGFTPLHLAAQNNHPSCVKTLLENGGYNDKETEYGDTPLDWGVNRHYDEVARLIRDFKANLDKGKELEKGALNPEYLKEKRKMKLRVLYDACKIYYLSNEAKFPAKLSDLYPDYVVDLSVFFKIGDTMDSKEIDSKGSFILKSITAESAADTVFIEEKTSEANSEILYITADGTFKSR